VLLNDVEVVEKPVPGGADIGVVAGGACQPVVCVVEDALRSLEPREQRGAALAAPFDELLPSRVRPRALREMFGAEQLAANRPGQQLLPSLRRGGEVVGQEARCARAGDRDRRIGREWGRRGSGKLTT
jgi:hypothetical protein